MEQGNYNIKYHLRSKQTGQVLLMEKYRKREQPKDANATKNPDEIRVRAGDQPTFPYLNYANRHFEEGGKQVIVSATGNAIPKAVQVVELIKRRFFGIHQQNQITTLEVKDVYEPVEEGLDPVTRSRILTMLQVTLSKDKFADEGHYGYQRPLPEAQIKPFKPGPFGRNQEGYEGGYYQRPYYRGGRRGQRGGYRREYRGYRGRGRNYGYDDQYVDYGHERGHRGGYGGYRGQGRKYPRDDYYQGGYDNYQGRYQGYEEQKYYEGYDDYNYEKPGPRRGGRGRGHYYQDKQGQYQDKQGYGAVNQGERPYRGGSQNQQYKRGSQGPQQRGAQE